MPFEKEIVGAGEDGGGCAIIRDMDMLSIMLEATRDSHYLTHRGTLPPQITWTAV